MITIRRMQAVTGLSGYQIRECLRQSGITGKTGGHLAGFPDWALFVLRNLDAPFWKVSVKDKFSEWRIVKCSLSRKGAVALAAILRENGTEARATPQLLCMGYRP